MKRILFLLMIFSSFSLVFSQSQKGIETIGGFETAAMSIDLNEVILTSSKYTKTHCSISYTKPTCTNRKTQTSFICCFKGVLINKTLTNEENNIRLFPNPSSNGFFNLNLKEKYNSVQVEVSSITGQKMQSQVFHNGTNKMRLDLSLYPSGMYLINIIADGKALPIKKAIRG